MTNPVSPTHASGRSLTRTTIGSLLAALALLILVVLPAEYGIDVTGVGGLLGLDDMAAPPARVVEIADITGGNEAIREVEIPDAGEPTALPNPAVFQDEAAPPQSVTLTVEIPAESETEVKLYMQEGKVAMFNWAIDQGTVYVDMHGHNPDFGATFFVRYKEEDEGVAGNGSLTAPFEGEHGWYWLNYNDFPVTITLTLSGYYEDVIDYGIF